MKTLRRALRAAVQTIPDPRNCILCSNVGAGCPHHPRPA
jgi:hypothetical protein